MTHQGGHFCTPSAFASADHSPVFSPIAGVGDRTARLPGPKASGQGRRDHSDRGSPTRCPEHQHQDGLLLQTRRVRRTAPRVQSTSASTLSDHSRLWLQPSSERPRHCCVGLPLTQTHAIVELGRRLVLADADEDIKLPVASGKVGELKGQLPSAPVVPHSRGAACRWIIRTLDP